MTVLLCGVALGMLAVSGQAGGQETAEAPAAPAAEKAEKAGATAEKEAASSPDEGQDVIGYLQTGVIFATDGDAGAAGEKATPLDEAGKAELRKRKDLKFAAYRVMGSDRQPVFRSYENWATPMKPSEEILLAFESKGRVEGGLQLDLQLWQSRKKIMKSDALLLEGRKLYVLGPKWRGGRLIIVVELVDLKPEESKD